MFDRISIFHLVPSVSNRDKWFRSSKSSSSFFDYIGTACCCQRRNRVTIGPWYLRVLWYDIFKLFFGFILKKKKDLFSSQTDSNSFCQSVYLSLNARADGFVVARTRSTSPVWIDSSWMHWPNSASKRTNVKRKVFFLLKMINFYHREDFLKYQKLFAPDSLPLLYKLIWYLRRNNLQYTIIEERKQKKMMNVDILRH